MTEMTVARKEAGIRRALCRAVTAHKVVMAQEAALITTSTVLHHATAHRAATTDKVVTAHQEAAHKATGTDRAIMVLRQVVARRAAIAARAVTETATIAAA